MFWERFCYLCEKEGKAPNRVAAEANLFSTGMITKYSNGAVPNAEILVKVANHFGVSVDYLLGRREDQPAMMSEEKWRDALLRLSDDSRSEFENYLDYLLWKQNRESEASE